MRVWLARRLLDVAVCTSKIALALAQRLAGGDSWDAIERLAPEVGWEVTQGCEARVRGSGKTGRVRRTHE